VDAGAIIVCVNEFERVARRLSQDPRVQAVYLFGSQASGEVYPDSDVDIAVLLGQRISLMEEGRMRAEVVDELSRDDVDFVILDEAPPLLRAEVVTGGRRLFARDERTAADFEDRAVIECLDTEYLRRMQYELLREAMR
jgi:uncharacterized protein